MLAQRVSDLLSKLESEEDRKLVEKLLLLAEEAKAHVELGYGSYALMRKIQDAYEPEPINLHQWSR